MKRIKQIEISLKCAREMYIFHKGLGSGCADFWGNECKRLRELLR